MPLGRLGAVTVGVIHMLELTWLCVGRDTVETFISLPKSSSTRKMKHNAILQS